MYPRAYRPNNNTTIIKKYNKSRSNTSGDLTKIHYLYEDVLPTLNGLTQKSLTTLAERSTIYQYLRSIFVKHNDGEDINIGSRGPTNGQRAELTNLLSHIKLMEMNPYHFSVITSNPYKTLPDNFLMFRSCYPVRLNRENNIVTCAPENLGLHIRIYQMRVLDILAEAVGERLKKNDCDIWREIAYYEFVMENILKPKKCPNFIMMYSWYKTYKSGVDFAKLQLLKSDKTKNIRAIDDNKAYLNAKIRDDMARVLMEIGNGIADINKLNALKKQNGNMAANPDISVNQDGIKVYTSNIKLPSKSLEFEMVFKEEELANFNIQFPTNKCIVSITEAPNHNLFDWGTKSYSVDMGPIKKMVQTGFHDIKVWQSIVFQLLTAVYVMFMDGLVINEMSIENNVYIKDLNREESYIGYWKYKVNGLDYYVPNFGYLLLIDSKYNDITGGIENVILERQYEVKYNHKIYGKMFSDTDKIIFEKSKENILRIFNPNTFGQGFTSAGGIKPPSEILNMFTKINNILTPINVPADFEQNLKSIFIDTQSHFLHNRIGKGVKDIEKDQLIRDDPKFKRGEILAEVRGGPMAPGGESFKWVICLGPDVNTPGFFDVYGVDPAYDNSTNCIIRHGIAPGDLRRSFTFVEQDFKPNQKLVEDDLLETYVVSF